MKKVVNILLVMAMIINLGLGVMNVKNTVKESQRVESFDNSGSAGYHKYRINKVK